MITAAECRGYKQNIEICNTEIDSIHPQEHFHMD